MRIKLLFPVVLSGLLLSTEMVSAKAETASPSPKTNRNQIRNLASPSASPIMEQERERERDKQGAQFTYTDGKVTLTTPSGNTHELKLPEEAIQNMERNGMFSQPLDEEQNEVTEVVKEHKKLFGVVPVTVDVNVTINTDNGQVVATPKSKWVKWLSFLFTE